MIFMTREFRDPNVCFPEVQYSWKMHIDEKEIPSDKISTDYPYGPYGWESPKK